MDHGMIARVARVDRWRVDLDPKAFEVDERGFAQFWGTVITADTVLEYGPLDGHDDGHLEFVPESAVFDEEAMASLKNAPITFLHPAEPVNARNSVRLTVGHIVEVKRDGKRLRALHQIEDAEALDKIGGGVIELSPGYTMIPLPGDGLKVDGREIHTIQSGRLYNHNAIVPEARAGHDNALTIDAASLPADGLRIQERGPIMAEYVFDGKKVEVDADLLKHIQSLAASAGDAEGDPDDDDDEKDEKDDDPDKGDAGDDPDNDDKDKGDAESADPPKDPANAGNDGAPKVDAKAIAAEVTKSVLEAVHEDRKQHAAATVRSSAILHDARTVLPASYQFDGQSDEMLMRAAIKERDPEMVKRAKVLKGDALFGFFSGVIAAPSRRTDSTPVPKSRTSYEDAIATRQRRTEVIANCGVTGDGAMSSPAVLKFAAGGKE